MSEKTPLRLAAAIACTAALVTSANTAFAAANGGTVNCGTLVASVAAHGVQTNTANWLYVSAAGTERFQNLIYTLDVHHANAKVGTWGASSPSLNVSASKGYCYPL